MLFSDKRTLAGKTHMGWFTVGPDQVLVGELNMEEPSRPVLVLLNQGRTRWKEVPAIVPTITGHLPDSTKVTLLGCTIPYSENSLAQLQILQHQTVTVVPDFVVSGNQHLDTGPDNLTKVQFVVDDTCSLRWGPIFQGQSLEAPDTEGIPIRWNREPDLFQADTALGRISAGYLWDPLPERLIPPFTPNLQIQGDIIISVEFLSAALSLGVVQEVSRKVLYFLGMVSGYPIEIVQTAVFQEPDPTSRLELFPLRNYLPVYETVQRGQDTEPIVTDGESMTCLLTQWIALGEGVQNKKNQAPRWDARQRFYTSCLLKGQVFEEDRLVAAGNLFDLMPESAFQPDFQLDPEYNMAVQSALGVLEHLPRSDDCHRTRQRGIGALKRLRKPTLKNRIQDRSQIVMTPLRPKLDQLCLVTDIAVDLRNHYVHGSKFKREISVPNLAFLTKTLEFVFVVSELIEAGWDIQGFLQRPVLQHFVKRYLGNYKANIKDFAK